MTERDILDKTIRDAQGVIDEAKRDLEGLKMTLKNGDYYHDECNSIVVFKVDNAWVVAYKHSNSGTMTKEQALSRIEGCHYKLKGNIFDHTERKC